MRALAWLLLLCIALAMAMPGSTAPRTTRNSQRANTDVESGDEENASPLQPRTRTRTITGAKTHSLKKSIGAAKDSGSSTTHDPIIGRPIWREIREPVFSTLNQVGGGLGDYAHGTKSN
jgi:hypothetical protein